MSSKKTTQLIKILEVLNEEGPLDSRKISEKGIPFGTVRSYTSLMTRMGFIRLHKGMRGLFEITEAGKKHLEEVKA